MSLSKPRLKEKSHLASRVKSSSYFAPCRVLSHPRTNMETGAEFTSELPRAAAPSAGPAHPVAHFLLRIRTSTRLPRALSPHPSFETRHTSQAGPHAVTQGRGTRHSEELLQPWPPQPAAPRGAPCHHAAWPLPARTTGIPLEQLKSRNWPLSFLLLALSPGLSLSPGPPASSKLRAIPTVAGGQGPEGTASRQPCPRSLARWQTALQVQRLL